MVDLLSNIPIIMELLNRIGFIILAFFFGGISFKGWRAGKNLLFRTISILILGLICSFGGLILKDVLGWEFIFADYISSLILAVILYILLFLISSGFKKTKRMVTREDIHSLTEEINNIKIQMNKVMAALNKKNLLPEELDEAEIKKRLKKELEKKKIKNYNLEKINKKVDVWKCVIKKGRERHKVIVDSYSGRIVVMEKIHSPIEFLYNNPLTTAGIICFLGLIIFLCVNINEETVSTINDFFSISFLMPEEVSESCISVLGSIELYNDSDNRVNLEETNFSIKEANRSTEDYIIADMSSAVRDSENNTYFIIITYPENITKMELSSDLINNIQKIRFCTMSKDYEVCECVGKQRTDIFIFKDYLLEQGLLEQAAMSMIISSLI